MGLLGKAITPLREHLYNTLIHQRSEGQQQGAFDAGPEYSSYSFLITTTVRWWIHGTIGIVIRLASNGGAN